MKGAGPRHTPKEVAMAGHEGSRRLHPRLRVFKNGDRYVNAVRSDAATTMACASPALSSTGIPPAPALAASAPDLAELRGLMQPTTKKRLSKRPKIEDQPKADDSFVNVFIELYAERSDVPQAQQAAARNTLDELLDRAVGAAKSAALAGAKLPRRTFISATIPVSLLDELEQHPAVSFVHPADPLKLDAPPVGHATQAVNKAIGDAATYGRGSGVLVGIIDVGGFDFAHPDFLDEDGETRFVSIWDQRGGRRQPPDVRDLDYGSEITQAHMNAAIAAAKEPGVPPATMLERQSQTTPGSHGTHVASIAAGKSGLCPEAHIAGVLIDVALPEDPIQRRRMTFSDTSRIIHGVEYLLDVATRMGVPLVVNISLGTNGGAHDGSSGVSRWLDAYLAAPGRAICIAAGNAGQEKAQTEGDLGWIMGRIHSQGRVPSRGLEVELEWTVVGDGIEDRSENELEIWYGSQDRFAVAVKPPGASDWISVGPREYVENYRLASGTTLSIYNELYHPTNGANYLAVYLSPNLDSNAFRGIEAGVWKVRLTGEEVRDGRFNAWIERDDPGELEPIGGRRFFRFPSFFTEATHTDSHSISSLACGHRVIAVSNLDDARQRINASSSQGPTRDGRFKPEIAAPGTDIVAANGFAHPDEPWVSMSGTSMASPHVSGVVALMLAANPTLTAAQCAGILLRTAKPLPGASYDWGNDVGYGRINPMAAIEEAKRANERDEVRPRGHR
jgi:subtilisin family serine protease